MASHKGDVAQLSDSDVALVLLVKDELEPMRVVLPRIDMTIFSDVFCMDGHSKDGSVEFLETRGIRVIRQKELGRGKAVIESGEHTEADALLFFSPDGNEDPRNLPLLVEKMKETNADLVISSRFCVGAASDDSDDPYRIRRSGNMFYSKIIRLLWGGGVTDAINGYRVIRKSTLQNLQQDARGYNIELQQTIRCLKLGKHIEEVATHELERIGPQKQSPTFKMGVQFAKTVLREIMIGLRFKK